MSIRKIRAGRVVTASATDYVGEYGTIFWDEQLGTLKISDGVTPGGKYIIINAQDINLAFGDFVAQANNLSIINPNEDLNLISNGSGVINLVGKLHIHTTTQGIDGNSVFKIDEHGFVTIAATDVSGAISIVNLSGNFDGSILIPQLPGVLLHLNSVANTPARLWNDGQNNYAAFVGRRYNNTTANPQPVLKDQLVARFAASAYSGAWTSAGYTMMDFVADEDQIGLARGTRIEWSVPDKTTSIPVKRMTLDQVGVKIENDLVVNGDLTVKGTTTSIDSTIVNIEDLNIVLAYTATTSLEANGAGITINGGNVTFAYNSTNDRMVLNKVFEANSFVGSVSGTVNNVTLTSLATGFSVAGGTTSKTLTVNKTITLDGTDGVITTLPSTSGTVALNNQQFYLGSSPVAINRTSGTLAVSDITATLTAGSTTVPPLKFVSGSNLTAPASGAIEYDGTVFYATPIDAQRGVIVAEQYSVLNADYTVQATATVPGTLYKLFPTNPYLSANTRHYFRIKCFVSHSTGNITASLGWQTDTLVLSKMAYSVVTVLGNMGSMSGQTTTVDNYSTTFPGTVQITTNGTTPLSILITGIIDVGATGGRLMPSISFGGNGGTIVNGAISNYHIYPIGASGVNTLVGNWA